MTDFSQTEPRNIQIAINLLTGEKSGAEMMRELDLSRARLYTLAREAYYRHCLNLFKGYSADDGIVEKTSEISVDLAKKEKKRVLRSLRRQLANFTQCECCGMWRHK